jgi:hypothetical protein
MSQHNCVYMCDLLLFTPGHNLVPWACDPREGMWGSGIIRCRKPGILAQTELSIPNQIPPWNGLYQSLVFLPKDRMLGERDCPVQCVISLPSICGVSPRVPCWLRCSRRPLLAWNSEGDNLISRLSFDILSTNKTIGKENFETCYIIIIVQAQSEWLFYMFF